MSRVKTWDEIIFGKTDCVVKGDSECWNWLSSLDDDGYGKVSRKVPGTRKQKTYRPHRIAYEISKGPIPEGLVILHTCDNRKCCNPAHLVAGTVADNNKDMIQKERAKPPKGEKHWKAKLTDTQINEVKQLYSCGGYSQNDLAKIYSVSRQSISKLVLGQRRNIK